MSNIKLYYFPLKGRAYAMRIPLEMAGIKYEFVPLTMDEFKGKKNEMPFGQLPVLEVDGKKLCQSHAIFDYVANLANFMPKDPWERAQVIQVNACLDDVLSMLQASFYEPDADKKLQMRKDLLAEDKIPARLKLLEAIVKDSSKQSGCCVGSQFTVCDGAVLQAIDWFNSGIIDGFPKDMFNEKDHPTLMKVREKVASHEKVKALDATYKK